MGGLEAGSAERSQVVCAEVERLVVRCFILEVADSMQRVSDIRCCCEECVSSLVVHRFYALSTTCVLAGQPSHSDPPGLRPIRTVRPPATGFGSGEERRFLGLWVKRSSPATLNPLKGLALRRTPQIQTHVDRRRLLRNPPHFFVGFLQSPRIPAVERPIIGRAPGHTRELSRGPGAYARGLSRAASPRGARDMRGRTSFALALRSYVEHITDPCAIMEP